MYNDRLCRCRVASEGLGFTDIGSQGSFDSRNRWWGASGEAEGDAGGVAVEDGDAG